MNVKGKSFDPARTRTWNLLIRSQAPYPLGHEARCLIGQSTYNLIDTVCMSVTNTSNQLCSLVQVSSVLKINYIGWQTS